MQGRIKKDFSGNYGIHGPRKGRPLAGSQATRRYRCIDGSPLYNARRYKLVNEKGGVVGCDRCDRPHIKCAVTESHDQKLYFAIEYFTLSSRYLRFSHVWLHRLLIDCCQPPRTVCFPWWSRAIFGNQRVPPVGLSCFLGEAPILWEPILPLLHQVHIETEIITN